MEFICNDWCGRADNGVSSGWISGDTIGFIWNAGKGGLSKHGASFVWPYIDAATFKINSNNLTYQGRPYIWNPNIAFSFGDVSANKYGQVGIIVFLADNHTMYPSIAIGTADNFSSTTTHWRLKTELNGTNSPFKNEWGDYIRIRPESDSGTAWIAAGYALQGGETARFIEPHYIVFGQKNIISGLLVGSTKSPVLRPNASSMISSTSISENPTYLYLQIITITVAAASAIAAWATRHYARKGFHFNALIKAFELLNDNAHRNARIRLYRVAGVENPAERRGYLMDLGVREDALRTIIAESQNIVLADMDQLGALVKDGLVPEQEFLDVYWNTIISCYEVLQAEEKTKLFVNFEDLYRRASNYKKPNVPLEKEMFSSSSSGITFHTNKKSGSPISWSSV
jgi:hypothetical protein